jgi:zinc transporter ZupT
MTFDHEDLISPILLSTIAGLSTTLGACFIYCVPVKNGTRQVPPGAMSFSLALAAGVMMTISFVSILPECFTDKTVDENGESSNILLPLGWTLITRVISFCLGAGLYFILSWCMTEPEQLLRDNISSIVGSQNIKCSYDDASDDIDIMLEDQRFLSENIRNRHFSHNSRSSSSDSLVTQQTNSWNSPTSLGLKDNINLVSWTMGKDLKKEHQEAWR